MTSPPPQGQPGSPVTGCGGPVCACSRPIKDHAFLCRDCTDTLAQQIGSVPALAADLELTRTRQSRTGGPGIGIVVRDAERPVPWNDKAARVAADLKATLVRWVRLCQDFRVVVEGAACRWCHHRSCEYVRSTAEPDDTAAALSRYLLASLPALRHRPEVGDCADDVHRTIAAVERVTDRPAEQTYYGPCGSVDYLDGVPDPASVPCPADLYGPDKATDLTCAACAAEHKVSDVRAYLLAQAQDQLVTAADLSRFLTAYGEPLTAERIRQWASRDLLAAHGKDKAGRPLYRVSEAVERLAAMATRRRESA